MEHENEKNIKKLIITAVLIAMTTVLTMFIQIPIPSAQGYLNIGDGVLMMAGLLLGPSAGFLVGGIGSGLADLFSGYAIYAPITLIVKGCEGALAGYLYKKLSNQWYAVIPSGIVMALGYFIAEIFLYNFSAALIALPMNLLQGVFGAAIAGLIIKPISNAIDHL